MDSLSTDPVATVLKQLFQEAEAADRPLLERFRNEGLANDNLTKFFEQRPKT
jgi:polyphosphate kinase